MGYIELKGLSGIPGLNSSERDKYFKDNEAAILEILPGATDSQIDELYLNNKISKSFGKEALNDLDGLDAKVEFWQNNYARLDLASQTYLGFNRYQTPYDDDAPKPKEGTWFEKNMTYEKPKYYDLRDWFDASTPIRNEKLTDEEVDAIVLDTYGQYMGDFKTNPDFKKDVDAYSKEIKDMFYSDRTLAADHFRNFVDLANEKSYYFRNYYGSNYLPLSIESAEELMSKYYAIKQLGNEEEADIYLNREIQNLVESKQSLPDKISATIGATASNMVGNAAVFLGLLANTPEGIWRSIDKKWEMDGVNGFEEFLYYSANNPLVRWGNNVVTTGFYNPESQKKALETGYNKNLLIKTYEESNGGFKEDFFTLETFLEAVAQTGFTYAGAGEALVGRGLAKATMYPVNKVATAALEKEMLALSNVLNKVDDFAMWTIPAFSAAYAEGSMEALNLSDNFMKNIESVSKKELYDKYFEDYLENNMQQPQLRIPTEDNPLTQEEVSAAESFYLSEYGRVRAKFENEVVNGVLNSQEFKDYVNRENAQIIASTTWKNTLWIGAGDALLSRMLGPAITEARHRILGISGDGRFKEVIRNGKSVIEARKRTGRYIGIGAKDVIWEGVEEGGQSIVSNVEEALAENNILNYINATVNGDSYKELEKGFFSNLDIVGDAFGQSFKDKETWKSFMMGALSTGMGRISPGQGIRTMANMDYTKYNMLGSSRWSKAKDIIKSFYYNPIIDAVNEAKSDYARAKADAEFFNSWIADESNAEMIRSIGGITSFVEKARKELHEGNEKEYRDTQLAATLRILSMFDKIEGTSYYNALTSYMETLSNIDNADAETKERVLQAARPMYSDTQATDKTILANVKKHSQEIKNMWAKAKDIHSKIESEFGRAIDNETKEAIVYGLIGVEDWKSRLTKLTDEILKASDKKGNVSSEVANAIIRIGNTENGKKLLEAARANLLSKRGLSKKSAVSREYRRQEVAKAKREIKQIEKDIQTLKDIKTEDVVLSRADILGLGAIERNMALNTKVNNKLYSEGTRDNIEAILNDNTLGVEFMQKVADASKIKKDIDYHDEFIANLRRSKNTAAILGYEIRAEAITKNLSRRVQDFKDETDYDIFVDKLTKFLELNPLSDFEKGQLGNVFWGNPNYIMYKVMKSIREAQHKTAQSTSAYTNTPKKFSRIIKAIIKNMYEDGNFESTEYARTLLTDGGFLNREGISLNEFTQEELDDIIDLVGDIITQTNNLFEDMKRQRDAKIETSQKPTPQPEVIPPSNTEQTEPEPTEDPEKPKESFETLGSFEILLEENISDPEQKEFYERNGVAEVLKALEEKYNTVMGLSQDSFYIYIDEQFLTNNTVYDSDNLPIAAAIEVDESFKGPYKEVDGKKVAIIGLIQPSRASKEDKLNTLNQVRRLSLSTANNKTFLLKDSQGFVTFKGASFTGNQVRNNAPEMETVNIMEFLVEKHGGNVEAALEDFLSHTFYGKVADSDTAGKESEVLKTRRFYYTKNGVQQSVDTESYTSESILYINDGKVVVLAPRSDYMLSNGNSVYNELSRENADNIFKKDVTSELNFITDAAIRIAQFLVSEKSKVEKAEEKELQEISKKLTVALGYHLNLLKRSGQNEGEVQISIKTEKTDEGKTIVKLFAESGHSQIGNWELASISLDNIEKVEIRKGPLNFLGGDLYSGFSTELKGAIVDMLRNLIFNNDGTVRKYERYSDKTEKSSLVSVVKPQIKYKEIKDGKTATKIFFSNLLYVVKTGEASPRSLLVNNNITSNEDNVDPEARRQNTLTRIGALHTQTKEIGFDKSEYTSVSDFIEESSELEEDEITSEDVQQEVVNEAAVEEVEERNALAGEKEVKFAVGTSLDSLLKLWFSPEINQDAEKLAKYFNDNKIGSWSFLTGASKIPISGSMGAFLRQAKNISDFLRQRGETIVSLGKEELELFAELSSTDGKTKKVRGIPDLITIDSKGEVHIYDYKTFTVNPKHKGSLFNGFKNGQKGLLIDGVSQDFGGLFNKYQRQLSMYKALLEAAIPGIKVASLGIIPIAVTYDTTQPVVIHNRRNPNSKAKVITTTHTEKDGTKKQVPFNITSTRIYNDFIEVNPIDPSNISPNKWEAPKGKSTLESATGVPIGNVASQAPVIGSEAAPKGIFESGLKGSQSARDEAFAEIMLGVQDDIASCNILG